MRPRSPTLASQFASFLNGNNCNSNLGQEASKISFNIEDEFPHFSTKQKQKRIPASMPTPMSVSTPVSMPILPEPFFESSPLQMQQQPLQSKWNFTKILWLTAGIIIIILIIAHTVNHLLFLSMVEEVDESDEEDDKLIRKKKKGNKRKKAMETCVL